MAVVVMARGLVRNARSSTVLSIHCVSCVRRPPQLHASAHAETRRRVRVLTTAPGEHGYTRSQNDTCLISATFPVCREARPLSSTRSNCTQPCTDAVGYQPMWYVSWGRGVQATDTVSNAIRKANTAFVAVAVFSRDVPNTHWLATFPLTTHGKGAVPRLLETAR
jgi:hypothetical protein